jgi:hypothetical protein
VFENIDKVTLTGSMEIGLSMCKKILLLSHVIVAPGRNSVKTRGHVSMRKVLLALCTHFAIVCFCQGLDMKAALLY